MLHWEAHRMCGIAGYLLFDQMAGPELLRAMCNSIRHRGPDDEGFHLDSGCAIGMRRLSIIDLATGHQPLSNEDGSVWIVFNGEIYNYRQLRSELAAAGHRFATQSDTETVVHVYEQEGVNGLSKLRGMFALAIWDARNRKLLLARDRFGEKPLYYALLPHGLFFASELRALRLAGVPPDLDHEALRLYFQFAYIPDPYSTFRTVRKVAAASWIQCDHSGRLTQGRYWTLPPPAEQPPAGMTETEARVQLRTAFDEAVSAQMIADVPLGAFLSGGIDSSSVVASMALQSSKPVKTFSIGFEEAAFNELDYARLVADKYRTEHHEILVKADSVALVTRLVKHFGEPFADSSAIPTYVVSEFAAGYVKAVLTGDGGDELFGGYTSFQAVERFRVMDHVPQPVRRVLASLADGLPYSAYGKNFLRMISRPTALERYFENNYSPYFLRRQLLQPEWMPPAEGAYLTALLGHCLLPDGADILTQAMYFETAANLAGDMLVKVDRMSMANSLEVRCPFLDHRLATLAASIPHNWKIRDGKGKRIFLDAVGDRLPPRLLARHKMGFDLPLATWLRGSLRSLLWESLTSRQFLDRGFVSEDFLRQLLEEHQAQRRNNSHTLWALLMLDMWFRDLEQPA